MKNKFNPFKYLILSMSVYVATMNSVSATIINSDFSFGSGTPFGGTTTIGGTTVTLTTTNTQPFGSTSFRDLLDTNPATVTFEFSAPINEFALVISRVFPPDEFLTNFNIGDPTILTGDLVNIGGDITSSQPGDFGAGSLIWSGINTSIVSFIIGNDPLSQVAPALAIDEFGINAVPPVNTVPGPASIWLFVTGFMSLIYFRKKTSSQA